MISFGELKKNMRAGFDRKNIFVHHDEQICIEKGYFFDGANPLADKITLRLENHQKEVDPPPCHPVS
jgi:hypothetical protein